MVGDAPRRGPCWSESGGATPAAWLLLSCLQHPSALLTSVGGRSPGHKAIVVIAVEGDQAPERVRMRRPERQAGHASISHAQLDYYLDEFTLRFNRRHARHRGLLFCRLLQGALAVDPHPNKALTGESAA